MNESVLSQLEEHINQLSIEEQLWLIARVAQRLQEHIAAHRLVENPLATMAADPAIQQELQRIHQEFACTEADGLESL